jgi:uncharacterized protein YjbJ (UPF0337 family)
VGTASAPLEAAADGFGCLDKDRVVGSVKQIKGAVKEVVGKAVGDTKLASEGKADKIEGQGSEHYRRPQRHAQREIGVENRTFFFTSIVIPPSGSP